MAVLKSKDIVKMSKDEVNSKLKDLQFELVKASTGANKASAKTKEIKRAIARLLTFNRTLAGKNQQKKVLLKNNKQ
jgi:ribosomal protein L29